MLVGCCLLQGGSMGMVNNVRGVFYTPVTSALGFGIGAFTLSLTISGICSCLLLPVVGRIFDRVDSRLLLGGCSFCFSGTVIGMGFLRSLTGFYVLGVLQGLFATFLMFFTAPFILGNWFKKRSGFAIGLCSAFSGLIGIAFNPIINSVIQHLGWQWGYYVEGGLSFLMMFPVSVFLLRVRPSAVGLEPYGAEEMGEPGHAPGPQALLGVESSLVRRSFGYWALVVAAFFCSGIGNFNSYLSPMSIQWGYGASVGAAMISISMAGNVISKFCLGPIYDRWGVERALTFGFAVVTLGLVMLLIPAKEIRLAGSFFYGFIMGVANIMPSITVKDVYGLRCYGDILSYPTLAVSLGSASVLALVGLLIDAVGPEKGYMLCLRFALVIIVLAVICYTLAIRNGRALYRRHAESEVTVSR